MEENAIIPQKFNTAMKPEGWQSNAKIRQKLNTALKLEGQRNNTYKSVSVLVIYWEEGGNEGFSKEGHQIGEFFDQKLHYNVYYFPIPSKDSHMRLDERINEFMRDCGKPNQLMIIHYGGHGDSDVSRERLAVWAQNAFAAPAQEDPKVDWSIIQPKLAYAGANKAHVLLLLDCCFAGQAARASENPALPSNVELLAACAMGVKTIGPGPISFTTLLIRLIEAELSSKGSAEISNIHNLLGNRYSGLRQTPIHFSGLKKTICLEPFNKNRSSMVDPNQKVPYLASVVMTAHLHGTFDDEDDDSTTKIQDWLEDYPRKIIAILTVEDVVESTDGLHRLLLGEGSESSAPRLEQLQTPAKHDVLAAWDRFSKALIQFIRTLESSPSISSDAQSEGDVQKHAKMKAQKILGTLTGLEDATRYLRRVVELSVKELPDLHSLNQGLQEVLKKLPMKKNSGVPLLLENCSNAHIHSSSDVSNQLDHPDPSSLVLMAPVLDEGRKGKGKAVATHSRNTDEPLARFESTSTSTHNPALWDQKPLSETPLDKERQLAEDPKSTGKPALKPMPSDSSAREPWRTTSQGTSRVSAKQLSQDNTANLLVAAREGNAPFVKLLIGSNANIEEVDHQSGLTPLLIAAKYRNTNVCRQLITSKAKIHTKDNHGRNVLHLALSDNGKEDVIPLLLDHGAAFDAQDKDGKTPLHYCVELDKRNAARFLLNRHAKTELASRIGETPLSLAIRLRRIELVKILLTSGAEVCNTEWRRGPKDIAYVIEKHLKSLGKKPRTLQKR